MNLAVFNGVEDGAVANCFFIGFWKLFSCCFQFVFMLCFSGCHLIISSSQATHLCPKLRLELNRVHSMCCARLPYQDSVQDILLQAPELYHDVLCHVFMALLHHAMVEIVLVTTVHDWLARFSWCRSHGFATCLCFARTRWNTISHNDECIVLRSNMKQLSTFANRTFQWQKHHPNIRVHHTHQHTCI